LIPWRRQKFNASFSPAQYARFLALLEQRCGESAQFRHSETPVFLPAELVDRMAQYGREMVEQLIANPQYQHESRDAIPPAYRAPNENPFPLFVQADFGLDQNLEPKLVEIQGFPSLYAYQPVMAECYREAYGIEGSMFPAGVTSDEYNKLLRQAILGGHDPDNVVLTEIDPSHQKTRHDFVITERLFGVRTVDITSLAKRGNRLYHGDVPIHRIYNRTIMDELERKHIRLPFDLRDELDVEWAGHPNWFFRLSKFSLPYLSHPAVPRTRFLDSVENPEQYVLKPLFSFAGVGVIVGPTREQIDAIPPERRHDYILQERVDFRPVIDTPFGPTKVEVRIMYIWSDGLRAVNTIIRMGRGSQMGVDHNKGMEWVGASAAFIEPGVARTLACGTNLAQTLSPVTATGDLQARACVT
jgi:hypothetical protein